MRKLLIATLVAAAAFGLTAIAGADPSLPNIPAHRHYVQTSQGLVQVGPRVCDNPGLQKAFNQYHSNVHHAVPNSPGPEQSAPGLHNSRGAEIAAGPCSPVAP